MNGKMVEGNNHTTPTAKKVIPAAYLEPGARLEAKDPIGEQWFAVKVTECDQNAVLVHYVQWNSRHDEWIAIDSPRLRVPLRSSSRHDSGGGGAMDSAEDGQKASQTSKDFKSGELVMAVWKLNRKFPAKVLGLEPDGTFLVEFYDGVQHCVKPNNIRRMRKDEEEQHLQLITNANGVHSGENSAENTDAEDSRSQTPEATEPSTSGRRERKKKFDLKSLFNLRPAAAVSSKADAKKSAKPSKSKLQNSRSQPPPAQQQQQQQPPVKANNNKNSVNDSKKSLKNKSEKVLDKSKSKRTVTSNGKVNNSSKKPSSVTQEVKNLPTPHKSSLQPVTGKRERKRKKFWDDEHEEASALPPPKVPKKPTKKEQKSGKRELASSKSIIDEEEPLKRNSKSSPVNEQPQRENMDLNSATDVAVRKETNGKVLKYRMFDMTSDPASIASKMIEGVNIPGPGVSIPVDSSKLPNGWEKRVIQRGIGVTKGKWDVFIVQEEGKKSFRSKTELQKYIDDKKLPYTSDAFDFSLDDKLKKLRQIWKQYIVKPRLSPGERMSPLVPAKKGRKAHPPKGEEAKPEPVNNVANKSATAEDVPTLGVASETGQGLRCSIPKCGKLFRNEKLLRQHVKHYHAKVFDQWLKLRREMASDNSDAEQEPPASSSKPEKPKAAATASSAEKRKLSEESRSKKARLRSEDVVDEDDSCEPPPLLCRTPLSRSRNDSILSVGCSDTDELQHAEQANKTHCPPTPPTFRLSKRRQAQLRRKKAAVAANSSLTMSMLSKVSASLKNNQGERSWPLSFDADGSIAAALRYKDDPMSPAAASASQSSYPPSEMDTSVTSEQVGPSEHLTTEEVVNCACRRMEEDGLMIQCDICLCWQHGSCLGIEEEDQVQDYYVCDTCRHPKHGRTGAQLAVDQDWLNKGVLPDVSSVLKANSSSTGASTVSGSESTTKQANETAFRKLSDLMADLSNLSKVLHSLRVKLHVASQSSNSKVFMWSSEWDAPSPSIFDLQRSSDIPSPSVPQQPEVNPATMETSTTTVTQSSSFNNHGGSGDAKEEQQPTDGSNSPQRSQEELKLTNGDTALATAPSETTDKENELEERPKVNGSAKEEEEESATPAVEEDVESLIPSLSEVKQLLPGLMSTLEQELPQPPPFIPEPKRLDKDECRLNLLQHIDAVQTEFENRLEVLEKTLIEIEEEDNHSATATTKKSDDIDPDNDPVAKTKAVLTMLLLDLNTSRNLVFSK